VLGWNLVAVLILMTVGWLISLPARNVTVVDSLWGLGFVLTAWVTFALADGYTGRRWLVTVLTTLWGLRLCAYLSFRNWGKARIRATANGGRQAGIISGSSACSRSSGCRRFSLGDCTGRSTPSNGIPAGAPHGLGRVGVAVWLIGFAFESIADRQLQRSRPIPAIRGKSWIGGSGAIPAPELFRRMPDLVGLFLIAFSVPGGVWTVISPVIITLVLLKMTGVPLTERTTMERRPGYRDYQRRTSTFIPWFPKKL